MKFDIARQLFVPAFITLSAITVAAMCGLTGVQLPDGENILPLLGGNLTYLQTTYPIWARIAAGIIIIFAAIVTGRIAMRYTLYGVKSCISIPLYAIIASGIAVGSNYLAGAVASALFALSIKNYCRGFCNGHGFDALFRASLYLGLLPLVYAPATPLILIMPLAIMVFKRTLRESIIASAGVLLPILTISYIYWAAGGEFITPATEITEVLSSGEWFSVFLQTPIVAHILLYSIVTLVFVALLFFWFNIYVAGNKSRIILIFIACITIMTAALLCAPFATPETLALLAIPAALLLPLFFVRIHHNMALIIYIILLVSIFIIGRIDSFF